LKFVVFFLIVTASVNSPAFPRLVATSPQTTELIFQLGLGRTLVGGHPVSTIPESQKLKSLGPAVAPSIESIVALNPDLVVVDPVWASEPFLRALTVIRAREIDVDIQSVRGLFQTAHQLLTVVNGSDANLTLAKYEDCWRGLSQTPQAPFRFLALAWTDPPILFGRKTFISDFIARLGGVPVSPAAGPNFPQVSKEWVLNQKVDRVFFLAMAPEDKTKLVRLVREWWPDRQHVATVALDADTFSRATFTIFHHLDFIVSKPEIPRECASL
jgi:hypothetical protein